MSLGSIHPSGLEAMVARGLLGGRLVLLELRFSVRRVSWLVGNWLWLLLELCMRHRQPADVGRVRILVELGKHLWYLITYCLLVTGQSRLQWSEQVSSGLPDVVGETRIDLDEPVFDQEALGHGREDFGVSEGFALANGVGGEKAIHVESFELHPRMLVSKLLSNCEVDFISGEKVFFLCLQIISSIDLLKNPVN